MAEHEELPTVLTSPYSYTVIIRHILYDIILFNINVMYLMEYWNILY